jgi:hypothetical protein
MISRVGPRNRLNLNFFHLNTVESGCQVDYGNTQKISVRISHKLCELSHSGFVLSCGAKHFLEMDSASKYLKFAQNVLFARTCSLNLNFVLSKSICTPLSLFCFQNIRLSLTSSCFFLFPRNPDLLL